MKGLFVTLEGIEGAGKSTVARLLTDELRKRGFTVLLTFEPGDTELGRHLRRLLLSPELPAPLAETELFLYLADRAEHVKRKILPALNKGSIVICDRFSDSTVAYQGYGRGIDVEFLQKVNHFATAGVKPDLTLLFDVDIQTGLQRNILAGKHDRFEQSEIEFHHRVRKGFLHIASREPERVKVIDASKTLQEVFRTALRIVEEAVNGRG